jgi:cbb3-type cytochrome oxidase subunit 3
MGDLLRTVVEGTPLWPALALLLFLAVFIGAVVWLFRPASDEIYRYQARLPLDDERKRG